MFQLSVLIWIFITEHRKALGLSGQHLVFLLMGKRCSLLGTRTTGRCADRMGGMRPGGLDKSDEAVDRSAIADQML